MYSITNASSAEDTAHPQPTSAETAEREPQKVIIRMLSGEVIYDTTIIHELNKIHGRKCPPKGSPEALVIPLVHVLLSTVRQHGPMQFAFPGDVKIGPDEISELLLGPISEKSAIDLTSLLSGNIEVTAIKGDVTATVPIIDETMNMNSSDMYMKTIRDRVIQPCGELMSIQGFWFQANNRAEKNFDTVLHEYLDGIQPTLPRVISRPIYKWKFFAFQITRLLKAVKQNGDNRADKILELIEAVNSKLDDFEYQKNQQEISEEQKRDLQDHADYLVHAFTYCAEFGELIMQIREIDDQLNSDHARLREGIAALGLYS